MKKTLLLIASLVTSISITAFDKICSTSQSFMFTRPIEQNIFAQSHLWYRTIEADDWHSTFDIQVLGLMQQTRTSSKQGGYFLINCSPCIRVQGDAVPHNPHRSVAEGVVRAEWLSLPSTYEGTLRLEPKQEQYGVLIMAQQSLRGLTSWTFLDAWWVRLSIPVVAVTQDIGITTRAANNTNAQELVTAFNQKGWTAGKMSPQTMHARGISSVNLAVGSTWWNSDDFVLVTYSNLSLPTGKRQDAECIFSPFLGANGHIAVDAAVIAEVPVFRDWCGLTTVVFFDIENHYYLQNHQQRILELHDKPWSRYLLVRREGEAETTQALNVLRQCVKVKPFNSVDLATGLSFRTCGLDISLGYNVWARNREEIIPVQASCRGRAFLFESYGIAGTGTNSASKSNITHLAEDDPTFVAIKPSDINLCATGSRGGATHRAFASVGYNVETSSVHLVFDLGGFIEFPRTNVALPLWGLWSKIGVAF